ncbi:MAG: hypothetical protein A3B22_00805 [Candidatus Zambryskibacteria bacterium RIFCSPLOWO2_01_FULL_47_33]|nr:MAG: hypothetical protein A3B22_00805 [Candidatus Zambryskibacteria bacterium RIFCSPLOWO2_01_FULL_47_33]
MKNLGKNQKEKTRQRSCDIAGSSWSAQSVVLLVGALHPKAKVQARQSDDHRHESENETGGQSASVGQHQACHDGSTRQRDADGLTVSTHATPPFLPANKNRGDDSDVLEHAYEHGPEHWCTAHPNPLEDHRRLNRGEDDPHDKGDSLNTRSGESRPHLRRERHRIHENQAGNQRFEELVLQETPKLPVQNINRTHRGLLPFQLGICDQATTAQSLCCNHSIIRVCRQGQQKTGIPAVFLMIKNSFFAKMKSPTDFFAQNSIQIGRRAKRGGFLWLAFF